MNTIQSMWESFSECLPADAPEIQRQEMQRAFYAGAMALRSIEDVLVDQGLSEDAAFAILDGVQRELRDFVALVITGKA